MSRLACCSMLIGVISCAGALPKPEVVSQPPPRLALGPATDFDVLTQHNDNYRSGASVHETVLSPQSVASGNFQRLFDWEVQGQIYAQPLYLSGVPFNGRKINVVIVATMENHLYAFEAPASGSDVQPSHQPIWHLTPKKLGEPLPYNYFSMAWGILGHNIKPSIGITSTPAVNRDDGLLYVTVKSGSGGFLGLCKQAKNELLAIDLHSGAIVNRVKVDATSPDTDAESADLDPKHHMQRAGVLYSQGRVYLAFGSHQDTRPYHGWVVSYDATSLTPLNSFCTTCGSKGAGMGGVWQAGGGPVADSAGNVYVMTGNGTYGAGSFATSFIKLDRNLKLVGSWTPADHVCLSRTDTDLGSAGPLFLPGQVLPGYNGDAPVDLLIGGGKQGRLYTLTPRALQGAQLGNALPGTPDYPCYRRGDQKAAPSGEEYRSIQAAPVWQGNGLMDFLRHFDEAVLSQGFHHIHGSPVSWRVVGDGGPRTLLYLSAERDLLRAYDVAESFVLTPGDVPKDTFESSCPNSTHGMPGGFLTLSADGDRSDSGIVWASMPRRDQDALHHIAKGILRAYRAYPEKGTTKLVEIWNSDNGTAVQTNNEHSCRDAKPQGSSQAGKFAKYASPTVAEGKVYLPTFSNQLKVYGLKTTLTAKLDAQQYTASLRLSVPAGPFEPGQPVDVAVIATNTSATATWHPGEVALTSADGDDWLTPGDPAALTLKTEVGPGRAYTFRFRVRVPELEEEHFVSWQLAHAAGSASPDSGQLGDPSPEWHFFTLRAACSDLRKRAANLANSVRPDSLLPDVAMDEAVSLAKEAKSRDCTLGLEQMSPAHAH